MIATGENKSTGISRVLIAWDVLRTALWPIPVIMSLLAILLYAGALAVDASGIDELALRRWRLYRRQR